MSDVLTEVLEKFNEHHDALGRFASTSGGSSVFPRARVEALRAEGDALQRKAEQIDPKAASWTSNNPDAIALQREGDARRKEATQVMDDWVDDHFAMAGGDKASNPYTDGLSPEGFKARDKYVVDDDATLAMNRRLREGAAPTSKVRQIDAMVQESTVTQPVTLFRGSQLPADRVASLRPGVSFRDDGFQSTDWEESGALAYAHSRAKEFPGTSTVLFEMGVPAGAHAVNVGYGEVVLPRGCTMSVTKVEPGADYTRVRVEVSGA